MEAPNEQLSSTEAEQFVARRITLRHARVLLAVLEAGTVSGAAERLSVTQPAISKTLAEIEDGLGAPLFAGGKRNPRPTPVCQRLAVLARKLEANLRRAADDVGSVARGASGELLIGTSNAALLRIVPDVMAAMRREFPRLTLNITSHPVAKLFDDLRAGRIDIMMARVPREEHPADLRAITLGRVPEVLVISRCHPLSSARRISWEGACESDWIWPLKGTRKRELQERLWRRLGLPQPHSLIELGDSALAIALMDRQPLFAILPLHTAELAEHFGVAKILPLEVDFDMGELSLWHVQEPQTDVVERFKTIVEGVLRAP